MSGRKSALQSTVRPHLAGTVEIGRYLLKEWREYPTQSAFGFLALDSTDRTHAMRILNVRKPDTDLLHELPELDTFFAMVRATGAAKFCLFLTHPDGNPEPHIRDCIGLPRAFHEIGSNITSPEFLDFFIIGSQAFYSYSAHGWMVDPDLQPRLFRKL